MPKRTLLNRRVSMHGFAVIYILLIVLGKFIRWTVMYSTLIGMSKGHGYPDHIINDPFSFQFFGIDEVAEGDIGIGTNGYSIFKIFWYLMLTLPTDFIGFEVGITIIWGIFLFLVIRRSEPIISMSSFIYISLSVIVISVYDFTLGKDAIQMLYFFLLFAVLASTHLKDKTKIIAGIAVVLLSVMTFRTYYILILVFGLIFYFIIKIFVKRTDSNDKLKNIQLPVLFLCMCLSYFVLMAVLRIFNGDLFNRMRETLLIRSDATMSANTFIKNLVAGESTTNVVYIFLEYALRVVRILCPVEVLKLGPKYWPYFLYQFIFTFFMVNCIRNYKKLGCVQKFAVILFVGYVFCSACFETDFGTWVRHNSTTFPIVLIASGIVKTDRAVVINDKNSYNRHNG